MKKYHRQNTSDFYKYEHIYIPISGQAVTFPGHQSHRGFLQRPTDENEAGSNDVCQQIASDRFIVFPVPFAKEADERVELVLTQALVEKQKGW